MRRLWGCTAFSYELLLPTLPRVMAQKLIAEAASGNQGNSSQEWGSLTQDPKATALDIVRLGFLYQPDWHILTHPVVPHCVLLLQYCRMVVLAM